MILTDLHKYTRLSYDQHNTHMCTSLVINMTYTDVHNNWCPKIIILGPIYRHRPDQYRSYTIAIPLLKWPYNQTVPSQTWFPGMPKWTPFLDTFGPPGIDLDPPCDP